MFFYISLETAVLLKRTRIPISSRSHALALLVSLEQHCVRYRVDQFRSPVGIRYSSNTTELISSEVTCEYLLLEFPPYDNSFAVPFGEPQPVPPTECGVFPNPMITSHVVWAGALVALCALPLKVGAGNTCDSDRWR